MLRAELSQIFSSMLDLEEQPADGGGPVDIAGESARATGRKGRRRRGNREMGRRGVAAAGGSLGVGFRKISPDNLKEGGRDDSLDTGNTLPLSGACIALIFGIPGQV